MSAIPSASTTIAGGGSGGIADSGGGGRAPLTKESTAGGSLSMMGSSGPSSSTIRPSAASMTLSTTSSTASLASAMGQQQQLHSNSKYKAYAQAVDKALKSFENTTEWADLIAALGKLGKVFASNSKSFSDIPSAVTVAKRLSQCLHPALPSGVHLKALETYRQVFAILGRAGNLPAHLHLYAIGLFPLMDHCGIKVKLELLSLFEQYLLPLEAAGLRPALPGFIAAVLLGLEEGTEFYSRTFSLLELVLKRVGDESFFTSFWQAVLGSSAVRLPALMFLNAKLEKMGKPTPVSTPGERLARLAGEKLSSSSYMIGAICALADDPGSTLIQRNLLDFLCANLPLDSDCLHHSELITILRHVLFVVLRRDISLNRRLYQWLVRSSSDVSSISAASTAATPSTAEASNMITVSSTASLGSSSSTVAASGMVGTPDEQLDLRFFLSHTLPMVRAAVEQFLQLDTVEIHSQATGSSASASASHPNHTLPRGGRELISGQLQFTEVRVCRLLHYLLDKPELGMPILNETLPLVLEHAAKQDLLVVEDLQRQCEEVDPSFGTLSGEAPTDENGCNAGEEAARRTRRLDETRKNLNSLLNSLDSGFLWQFLGRFFSNLQGTIRSTAAAGGGNGDMEGGFSPGSIPDSMIESLEGTTEGDIVAASFYTQSQKEHLTLYPLVIAYAIKTVQLDAHSDIRGKHLAGLLGTILTGIRNKGCDSFYRDNLVALLVVARRVLSEINQSVAVFEAVQAMNSQAGTTIAGKEISVEGAAALANKAEVLRARYRSECAEEQRLVEASLNACFHLLSEICTWYSGGGRERDKTGVLCAIAALLKDFSDFPFYCFDTSVPTMVSAGNGVSNIGCLSISETLKREHEVSYNANHPVWLADLLGVVDAEEWNASSDGNNLAHKSRGTTAMNNGGEVNDFDIRAKVLDLVLYLYVRSASVLEQHAALMTRQAGIYYFDGRENSSASIGKQGGGKPVTTSVLLKPFMSSMELERLERDSLFKKSAVVLWKKMGEGQLEPAIHRTAALLLLQLHSRRSTEASSEVEELVVADLTSLNKRISGTAAKKFRDLWTFSRISASNGLYHGGVPLKPLNRAVMVMLGFIADELVANERVEMKAAAYAWFLDCSRHNDLHKIFQMLFLMLLNPATARVSVHYVQVEKRITKEQFSLMPREANVVTLRTIKNTQPSYHHVCRDIDVQSERQNTQHQQPLAASYSTPWNNFSYIDCHIRQRWVEELNKQLLLPTSYFETFGGIGMAMTADSPSRTASCSSGGGGGGLASVSNLVNPMSGVTVRTGSTITTESAEAGSASHRNASLRGHEVGEARQEVSTVPNGGSKSTPGHRRTMSDIPQFDEEEDAESISSLSLDTLLVDNEVYEAVQFLVDSVAVGDSEIEVEEEVEQEEAMENGREMGDEGEEEETSFSTFAAATEKPASAQDFGNRAKSLEEDETSVVGSLHSRPIISNHQRPSSASLTGALSNVDLESAIATSMAGGGATNGGTIRRVKCGHRRQDSLQESIFNTTTQELRFFDLSEQPITTHPGDGKQPLMDEPSAHMLFYTENPGTVDLGRAEKIFRTIGALLKNGHLLGKHIVNLLFTNISHLRTQSGSGAPQLMELMINHLKEILGYGFWASDEAAKDNQTIVKERNRNPTLFEIFSTVAIFYLRSYYLNSPTNYVSSQDLVLAWKCKIAALDCFAEMLRVLDESVRAISSRDFAIFAQQVYQCTKAQKAIIHLLLTAVPSPPTSMRPWRMPLTVDIIEFNNGPLAEDYQFGDLISAYQRSLLNLTLVAVALEYDIHGGVRNYSAQGPSIPLDKLMEQTQRYNSPQNRATIRGNLMVEIRMFISVLLSALKRCPERHELWLQFLISSVPYLDRALPTVAIHVVEQLCRNIYESLCADGANSMLLLPLPQSPSLDSARSRTTTNSPTLYGAAIGERRASYFLADFRLSKRDQFAGDTAPPLYPVNYTLSLMEAVMALLHYCMADGSHAPHSMIPFVRNSAARGSLILQNPQMDSRLSAALGGAAHSSNSLPANSNSPSAGSISLAGSSGGGGGSSSMAANMTSMMGSAISVIPGTTLINSLIGRVFTSGDSSNQPKPTTGVDPSIALAQKELLKLLPSVLAILCDVWTVCQPEDNREGHVFPTETGTSSTEIQRQLVLDILNPIASRHLNALVNSFATVWIARSSPSEGTQGSTNNSQPSFVYSPQQRAIAKLVLALKQFPLKSLISSIAESLRESAAAVRPGTGAKPPTLPSPHHKEGAQDYVVEVAALELLHECVRQVSTVGELRDAWDTMATLLSDTFSLGALPARASFLEFMLLVEFVRRCSASQPLVDDPKLMTPTPGSKSLFEVCQRLTDAVNSIIGWQLESTTWLKRTLVVKQEAAGSGMQKSLHDVSPTVELRGSGTTPVSLPPTAATSSFPSETSSMRSSTISLATGGAVPPAGGGRFSSIEQAPSVVTMANSTATLTGSVAQLSQSSDGAGTTTTGARRSMVSTALRSSVKDPAKKDPTDSTRALFLLAAHLTELIDSVTRSEDKEKAVPTLQGVWANTLPYLRAKSAKNVRFFLAGSQFLASMSSFNYMRVVWKKNTMELLLDPGFFKMDIHALKQWLITVDNLMSNDKVSFKDLLSRMMTSTPTLSNLITSKEQEYEMRAQALKRLSFVILSSEMSQYSSYLGDIHERLTDSLRLSQAPVVYVQVFTCYRVLLVRVRPSSFVAMWPSMVTELVQVLTQIEQQLSGQNANVLEDLRGARDDAWMQLYLTACKLLEALCTLPSDYVAQFQMCRWAFVSSLPSSSLAGAVFTPYAMRINTLMNMKYGEIGSVHDGGTVSRQSASLFNIKTLTSFQELHPFFHSLAHQFHHQSASPARVQGNFTPMENHYNHHHNHNAEGRGRAGRNSVAETIELRDANQLTGMLSLKAAVAKIELSLYVDFADHWQL